MKRSARKSAVIASLAVLSLEVGYTLLSYLTPSRALLANSEPDETRVGRLEEFPAGTVTYIPDGRMFIVNDGFGLRAISDIPHDSSDPSCKVTYVPVDMIDRNDPPLRALSGPQPGGGFFRGPCDSAHFNWWRGEDLNKYCECGLDHYRVWVAGNNVFVDTSSRLPFQWEY
jgi:hypothetical protein